jgi:hypothetical protein
LLNLDNFECTSRHLSHLTTRRSTAIWIVKGHSFVSQNWYYVTNLFYVWSNTNQVHCFHLINLQFTISNVYIVAWMLHQMRLCFPSQIVYKLAKSCVQFPLYRHSARAMRVFVLDIVCDVTELGKHYARHSLSFVWGFTCWAWKFSCWSTLWMLQKCRQRNERQGVGRERRTLRKILASNYREQQKQWTQFCWTNAQRDLSTEEGPIDAINSMVSSSSTGLQLCNDSRISQHSAEH